MTAEGPPCSPWVEIKPWVEFKPSLKRRRTCRARWCRADSWRQHGGLRPARSQGWGGRARGRHWRRAVLRRLSNERSCCIPPATVTN